MGDTAQLPPVSLDVSPALDATKLELNYDKLTQEIEILKENGVDRVWVTRKYPLLVFLWPALIPLILIGGPMAYLMPLLGL